MPPRSSCACSTPTGERELERIELPEYTDEVWHGYLPDARPGHDLRLPRPRAVRADGRPPLQSEQAAARPLRQAARRPAALDPTPMFGYRSAGRATTCPSTGATARRSCRSAGWSIRPSPGATTGRRASPWERDDHLRDARERLHHAPSGRAASSCAAPTPGSGAAGVDRAHPARSASRRSNCCRCTPSSTTGYLIDKGLRNYWGYNTIGFFAPEPRYRATRRRSPSSRRWSRACTMPASR